MLKWLFSQKAIPVLNASSLAKLMPVSIVVDGYQQPIVWKASQTVLSALEDSGIPVRHSCRNGNCGACRAELVTGKVGYRLHMPSFQSHKGSFLMCSAVPLSDIRIALPSRSVKNH